MESKCGGNCDTGMCSGDTLMVFLGAFAYSLKASVSFEMSVCQSISLHVSARPLLHGFS
jgi:hypothetical protein